MYRSYAVQQTATQALTASTVPTVTVTDRPTIEQLQVWWKSMQNDDLSVAYADSFPETLTDFRLEVAQGDKTLLLCLVDGQVAGALWLHDMWHHHDGTIAGGWLGGYILPAYRGRLIVQLWQEARRHWEATGVVHFFSAVNVANRRSQAMLTRGLRFHLVGRFPDFLQYHGQLTDLFIYTLHAEDMLLAWERAAGRAARQTVEVE
jgi:hypothetical protein